MLSTVQSYIPISSNPFYSYLQCSPRGSFFFISISSNPSQCQSYLQYNPRGSLSFIPISSNSSQYQAYLQYIHLSLFLLILPSIKSIYSTVLYPYIFYLYSYLQFSPRGSVSFNPISSNPSQYQSYLK